MARHALFVVGILLLLASLIEAQERSPTGDAVPLRARLRKQPELVLTVDMEPCTLKGDQLGAPVEAALSPNGKYLAVGGKFKVIRFFDGQTGKFLCRRPGNDKKVRIWRGAD